MNDASVFVHPQGLCESEQVGRNTRIWAFAHVLPQAVIGADCNICDHVFIENRVCIGNRVTIKCGVQLWDGITIEDDVFVGPNATFTNDRFPRSKVYPDRFAETRICAGASIGANATILPGLTIGRCAMIGAGAVVTRSVPAHAIVKGNPARITGYVQSQQGQPDAAPGNDVLHPATDNQVLIDVAGVKLQRLNLVRDLRGALSVGEVGQHIPFPVQRYFLVFDVPNAETRGEHAHLECHQFLVCVKGSLSVLVDDGYRRREVRLDHPQTGLQVPPRVWITLYRFSMDAVLLVLASEHYRESDYLRNYDDFLAIVRS